MTSLESTRQGWFFCGIGALFVLLAIGLTVWDLAAGSAIWPVNIVTLAAGIANIHFGRKNIRRAQEHHQFMEQHRAEMTRMQNRWLP